MESMGKSNLSGSMSLAEALLPEVFTLAHRSTQLSFLSAPNAMPLESTAHIVGEPG